METSDLIAETPSVSQFPEQVDDGHRLSHIPFYFVVGVIGLWSVLALFYRIAGY